MSFKNVFVFLFANVLFQIYQNNSILQKTQIDEEENEEDSQPNPHCSYVFISLYTQTQGLTSGQKSSQKVLDKCPDLEFTCCKNDDLISLVDEFEKRMKIKKSVEFNQYQNFATQYEKLLKQIQKGDIFQNNPEQKKKFDQCNIVQGKTQDFNEKVQEGLQTIKNIKQTLDSYYNAIEEIYSGFPCNLCQGEDFYQFDFNEDLLDLPMNFYQIGKLIDLWIIHSNIIEMFFKAQYFSQMGYCLNGSNLEKPLKDSEYIMYQRENQLAENCKQEFQQIYEVYYDYKESINYKQIQQEESRLTEKFKECLILAKNIGPLTGIKLESQYYNWVNQVLKGFSFFKNIEYKHRDIKQVELYPLQKDIHNQKNADYQISLKLELLSGWNQLENTTNKSAINNKDAKEFTSKIITCIFMIFLF